MVPTSDGPRIGIDFGGTKIEAVLLGPNGAVQQRLRVPTPRGDYRKTLEAVADLVAEIEERAGTRAPVGIGHPGAISPATGLIKNANSVWLNGKPLQQDLEARLERPLCLANDADCFALSEATDGAASGAGIVFGVILGTGVGGGIVINGRPVRGPNAITGEWGHNPLPAPRDDERPGPTCYCGNTGCIETFLSGPALSRDHEQVVGTQLSPHEIAERADEGDDQAEATLSRYEERLARALAGVINILDPDVIVLGGGLSNLRRLYERVPPQLLPRVFSDSVDTRIVPPTHGDSSGVRGAALLRGR